MVGLAIVCVLTAFFSDAAMDLMSPTWRLILLFFWIYNRVMSLLFKVGYVASLERSAEGQ